MKTVLLGIVTFVIGAIYGYVHPGKEDRTTLLLNGLKTGVAIGMLFVFIGICLGAFFLSWEFAFANFLSILGCAIGFILGTLLGDYLEDTIKGDQS